MEPTRREFLVRSAGAAAPIVFLSPLFRIQEPAEGDGPAGALRRLRDEMARTRRPGLLVRFPDSEIERTRLLRALDRALVSSPWMVPPGAFSESRPAETSLDVEVLEVFGLVVAACAEDSVVRAVPGARPEDDLLVLDEEGRRIEGDVLPVEELDDPHCLVARLRRVVFGLADGRVRDLAARARREAPREAVEALDRLAQGGEESPSDRKTVRAHFWALLPAIVLARTKAKGIAAERLVALEQDEALVYDPARRGPWLPYGLEFAPVAPCGGGHGGCGMAYMLPRARRFVGLLGAAKSVR